jgi:hypothetical protein
MVKRSKKKISKPKKQVARKKNRIPTSKSPSKKAGPKTAKRRRRAKKLTWEPTPEAQKVIDATQDVFDPTTNFVIWRRARGPEMDHEARHLVGEECTKSIPAGNHASHLA